MSVTIITIIRNAENCIERTVQSVLAQSYTNIEYLIIDGASTDGTLGRIEKYRDRISKIVSEPDSGISDAWNKGLSIATGDVVGLLNAGDEYAPDAVKNAVESLVDDIGIVYGDTALVDDEGRLLRQNVGRFHLWRYSGGLGFYHPSLFAKRSVYSQIGLFNKKLRYAMDTDWILRAHTGGIKLAHAPIRVRMLDGGVSVSGRYAAFGEYLQTLRNNGIADRVIYLSMINTGLRGLLRTLA